MKEIVSADPVMQPDLRAIFEYAARIGSESNFDELLRLNAEFARDLVGADRCSLWLFDGGTNELWTKVSHGIPPIRIPSGQGLVGYCFDHNSVVLVNNAEEDPRLLRQVDGKSGYRTKHVLCIPLRLNGKAIGALQLLNKPEGFSDNDAEMLALLAHFSASAIEAERLRQETESARLLRYELSLAREVQSHLLPGDCLAPRGIECSAFCRPARTIGGDYYDLLNLNDGRFAFTVGDVSGKGIPAAVMMASIQMLLRNNLCQQDAPHLSTLLAELNRTLYLSSTSERYTTLFCGIISSDRSHLTYVNAGHVSPLLLHKDGTVERLEGSGIPAGLLAECSYEESFMPLLPGDRLLIISDGIIEACNLEGEFWGEEELESLLQTCQNFTAKDLQTTLCREVERFAKGADQYDDMTVVAIRIQDDNDESVLKSQ